ncbi:MAG: glycosyltransferase [Candidatus Pacebacteria bacterium]|nr:glycosyltransferase [Candidatus Paceibacterota bacterium]
MKILLYTDLAVRTDQLFWHRDLGLLTKAFHDLGHDALLVVHPATEPSANPAVPNKLDHPREQPFEAPPERSKVWSEVGPHSEIRNSKSPIPPVLWVSQQDIRDPLWWQSHKPDLVILGLWTRPKYNPIRRAALSATPHVIERADSDGMRTASCGLLTYAKRRFDYFRDRAYHWPSLLSIPASFFYSFASIIATPWIEYRLRKTLRLLPSILVETPHATALWKSLARRLGADPEKIHHVPHPIQTDIFKFDPTVPKKNQIISVGRWESYQKNLPLLLKTLCAFLDKNPTWSSLVIGSGLPTKSPHPQITFLPPTDPTQLARQMQESKIFLSSSRYESFGLAGAEAEMCGCKLAKLDSFRSPNLFTLRPQTDQLISQMIQEARTPTIHCGLGVAEQCASDTVACHLLQLF